MLTKIQIESLLIQIQEELKKIVRRQEQQKKQLDNIDSDRVIFEDILGRLTAVEERLRIRGQHDIEANREIKSEINEVKTVVTETIEDSIGKNKVVQNKKRSWLSRLIGGEKNK